MKFYITKETKQELEAKIAELEQSYLKVKGRDDADEHYLDGARTYLKEVLSNSVVLPVEKDWYDTVPDGTLEEWGCIENELKTRYPNGVIIEKENKL